MVKKCIHPYQCGQFSFKMTLEEDTGKSVDILKRKNWKKFNKRLTSLKVRAFVYQARDLPAADAEGTSDPYCKIWDTTATEKNSKTTIECEDNCNPMWYECVELDYEVENFNDLETYPPFIFDIYDKDEDLFDSTDDYLCRCIVEPEDCAIYMCKEKCDLHDNANCALPACRYREVPKEPRWHICEYSPNTGKCGELLVSFAVAEDDYEWGIADPDEVDLDSLIEKKEMNINMNILGMRNLLSPGILPVRKAFIKFGLKSLVPPNGAQALDKTTTPNQPGPNPTLNTTMTFSLPLPVNKLYCPKLTCTVYDNIFAGWNQPLIGVFVLDLGHLRDELTEERETETKEIQDIIN